MKRFDAFKQFLSFSFKNKKLLILALLISMSMPAIDLPFPFLMRKLFNVLTVEKTWALIVTWVGAVTAANFILNGFRGWNLTLWRNIS